MRLPSSPWSKVVVAPVLFAFASMSAACSSGGLSEEDVQSRVDAGVATALAAIPETPTPQPTATPAPTAFSTLIPISTNGRQQIAQVEQFTADLMDIETARLDRLATLDGLPPLVQAALGDGVLVGTNGLIELRSRLLNMAAPKPLEPVRDLLLETYEMEITAARENPDDNQFRPWITWRDSEVTEAALGSRNFWIQAQVQRKIAYEKLRSILIDEGFDIGRYPFLDS